MSSPEEIQALFYNSPGLQPYNYYVNTPDAPTVGTPAPTQGSSAPGSGFGPSRLINDAFGRAWDMAVDYSSEQPEPGGGGGGSDPNQQLIEWLLSQGQDGGSSSGSYDPFAQGYYDLARDRFGLEQQRFGLDQQYFGLDQNQFAASEEQRALDNEWRQSQFNYNASMDDRDWALSNGYLDLAVEKENAANYWKGKSLQAEMAMNAADNAARVQVAGIGAQAQVDSANISANAQMTSAQIAAAANRLDSYNRLQVGLAGAHNDAERNQIIARWNQEQANIAKMEDETRRLLGTQQNSIDLWRAETDRHNVSGQLAQRQNELIAQMASTPRDLFGLYFMQRGITPDWDALQAGNPTTGSPITVQNALTAYTPQNALPQITNENSMFDTVGQASSYTPSANPHLTGSLAQQMGETGKYSGGGGMGGFSTSVTNSLGGAAQYGGGGVVSGYGGFSGGGGGISLGDAPPPISIPKQYVDANPGGMYGGVPVARLQPGLNLSTVGGGDITGANFTMPAYYDQAMTQPIGPTDVVTGGSQVWVNAPGFARGTNEVDYGIPRYADGTQGRDNNIAAKLKAIPTGFTTAKAGIVGDARGSDPRAGGAKPEMFLNPTGAPIQIADTNSVDFGAPTQKTPARQLDGSMAPVMANLPGRTFNQAPLQRNPASDFTRGNAVRNPVANYARGGAVRNQDPMDFVRQLQMYQQAVSQQNGMPRFNDGTEKKGKATDVAGLPEEVLKMINNPQLMSIIMKVLGMGGKTAPQGNAMGGGMSANVGAAVGRPPMPQGMGMKSQEQLPRYATGTGTDVSQQYADMGMGNLYLQSSNNPHITDPNALPPWLQTLHDYGAPLAPSLVNSVTGASAPTLNTGAAFTGRGGGTLPSLQTFGRQTKGETDLFRGYAEGPVGISFTDIVDFLAKPTQNLQSAQRSRGQIM